MEQEQKLQFEDAQKVAKRLRTKPSLIVRAAVMLEIPVFVPVGLEDNSVFIEKVDQLKANYSKGGNNSAQNLTPEQRLEKSQNANRVKSSGRINAQ